jgi:hypothetical protein
VLEIWKTVIEHLSWPFFVLVLALLFRKPLTDLLGRINNIKAPGFELAAPPASAQIETKVVSPPETLKGEIPSNTSETAFVLNTTAPALAANLDERRKAVRNFGHGIPLIDESVRSIKADLAALEMPLSSEDTTEVLVWHLATTQMMLRCERTHRLIYGSQIVALHLMNNGGPQPESALHPIFDSARAKEPQFYGSYTFEDWLGFLFKEVTVTRTGNDLCAITVYGRSYLQYIGIFANVPKPH